MTDDMMLNRYKNQVRQLEEQVTSLKIENAALKQRERGLLTTVQLNEGIVEDLQTMITGLTQTWSEEYK